MKLSYVAVGGALGAILRYVLSALFRDAFGPVFPWGTLFINLSGCLTIGFLAEIFEKTAVSPEMNIFLLVGVVGTYTTFSTFGLETFNLIRDGKMNLAILNVLFNNLVGILFVFLGFGLSKYFMDILKLGAK
ncbi:fluoride efflux transporter CrcB [Candidatus Saganbacteria bacterium]|nr:fluoride efflux transporter CrcB [Candidatus Saganbacteria bacterium]